MRYLFVRWLILALAIGATLWMFQRRGITFEGGVITIFGVALVYPLVNAIVRPIVTLLTCPLVILTLGLFMLVINTAMLMFTAWLVPAVTITGGFFTAFLASIVISIIAAVLTSLVHDDSTW